MATPNSGTYRCTFSLPRDLATDIAFVAKRMGVSQSAMLAELLAEPIAAMRSLAEQVPADRTKPVDPDTVLRLRGQSADLVRTAVRDALELANALDAAAPITIAKQQGGRQ